LVWEEEIGKRERKKIGKRKKYGNQ
jgi:hypothetical protein